MQKVLIGILGACIVGCDGPQSALSEAGQAAQTISTLFYWMLAVACAVWVIVVTLCIFAIGSRRAHPFHTTRNLIIGGGVLLPTVVLTGLLAYGLSILPDLQRPAPAGSLTIEVEGLRWWWRVRYRLPSDTAQTRESVELANELVLPVGRHAQFVLTSADVVHSFWIPSLGGKMDMIPGRETRLALLPLREGIYRGVCAEYCGTAHAQMAFAVRVVSEAEFSEWLEQQQRDATRPPDSGTAAAEKGAELFLQRGCGACHTIRGTLADGRVGPDLTHFGSRRTLGGGVLRNDAEAVRRWLANIEHVKPGVEMPQFAFTPRELDELVGYLEQLE